MSFKRVAGHSRQIEDLKKRLLEKRLPHALVFTGPAGVGKRLVARGLVKAIFCGKSDSCDACDVCRRVDQGNHPDLVVLRPNDKGHILIADVRAVLGRLALKSFESGSKAVIVEEAERMNEDAQNSLLKVLEEPQADTFFVLVTSDMHGLFPTVLSRCQRVPFDLLSGPELSQVLKGMPDAAPHAAEWAPLLRGSLERLETLKDADLRAELDGLFERLRHLKSGETFPLPDRSHATREEALFEMDALAEIFRDALLLKLGLPSAKLFHFDRQTEIARLSERYSADEINEALCAVAEARDGVEHSLNLRLVYLKLWSDIGARILCP